MKADNDQLPDLYAAYMVGIPVFSGFTAGVGKLAGPTGGYLVGFIPMALIVGFFRADLFSGQSSPAYLLGMVLGPICDC